MGARPDSLGAAAGRAPRGALAQAAAQHAPSLGLAGMRAPRSAAKSLSGAQPLARPVKAPIGNVQASTGTVNLPQPIHPKIVRQPIQQPVVSLPTAIEPIIEPVREEIVKKPELDVSGILDVKPEIEEIEPEELIEDTPSVDIEESITEPQVIIEEEQEETTSEEKVDIEESEIKPVTTATLMPIKKLEAVEQTTVLKPVTKAVLTPIKSRGPPPSSEPGMKPGSRSNKTETTTLKPVTVLKPVESPNTTLNIEEKEE